MWPLWDKERLSLSSPTLLQEVVSFQKLDFDRTSWVDQVNLHIYEGARQTKELKIIILNMAFVLAVPPAWVTLQASFTLTAFMNFGEFLILSCLQTN
jgi:hypothetical protein